MRRSIVWVGGFVWCGGVVSGVVFWGGGGWEKEGVIMARAQVCLLPNTACSKCSVNGLLSRSSGNRGPLLILVAVGLKNERTKYSYNDRS